RSTVGSALRGFKDAGFPASEISVIMPDRRSSKEIATVNDAKAPQRAAAPAGSGVRGALGSLTGVGALNLPRLGPVIAAGPLVEALAGRGATQGDFSESLSALGVPEVQAARYEQRLRSGGVLAAIHCQTAEQIQQAREIMEITCAEEIVATGNPLGEPTVPLPDSPVFLPDSPMSRGKARSKSRQADPYRRDCIRFAAPQDSHYSAVPMAGN
ncbi:MAG: hypothetical protein WAK21_18075, partial [Candidatus Sulfotelmatobacter sp.]